MNINKTVIQDVKTKRKKNFNFSSFFVWRYEI